MDSKSLSSIALTLASSTSLPPTIAQEVKAQAATAPPPVEVKPAATAPAADGTAAPAADGTAAPAADGTAKPVEAAPAAPTTTAPSAPVSTSTGGGGGSAIDQLVQKITDTVQQNVEKAVQTNPSGTGG
jgi:hypothetical protein